MGNRSRYRRPKQGKRFFDGPRLGRYDGGEPEPGENFAPFGDVPMFGAPMPSEMHNGWRWYAERLHMVNVRGALPYVGIALLILVVVIVIRTAVTG